MNNLKLKVWDKINKQMLPCIRSVIWDKDGSVSHIMAGKTQDFLKDGWFDLFEDEFELLLWTDIKDKRKNDVYSGHILLIPDFYHERILDDGSGPNEPFNHLAPVVFQSGCFGVNILESGYLLQKRFYTFIELESEGVDSIEIVGDIYQNSDLLKTLV